MLSQIKSKLLDGQSRTSLFLVAAQLCFTLALLFVDIFLARSVSEATFGYWKQFLLAVNILVPMFAFGLPEGFKYFSALEEEKRSEHFWNVSILILLISIPLFVLFHFLGSDILNLVTDLGQFNQLVLLIPALFVLLTLTKVFRFHSINIGQTKHFFGGFLTGALCFVSSFVYFDFQDQWELNIVLFILSGFLGNHLFKVLYFFIFIPLNSLQLNLNAENIKKYLNYGIPLFLSSFIAIVTLNTDKTIVSKLSSIEEFALFSVGAKEVPLIALVSTSFAQTLFPILVKAYKEGETEKAKNSWLALTRKVSMLVYPIVLVLMIIAEPLIVQLFGEKYQAATPIFQVYLLVVLWRNNYYGGLLAASGQTKWITFYGLFAMLFNLVTSYLFYQVFGAIGVAYGTLATVSLANILQLKHEGLLLCFIKEFLLKKEITALLVAVVLAFLLT